jgi:hypothetical protein
VREVLGISDKIKKLEVGFSSNDSITGLRNKQME